MFWARTRPGQIRYNLISLRIAVINEFGQTNPSMAKHEIVTVPGGIDTRLGTKLRQEVTFGDEFIRTVKELRVA